MKSREKRFGFNVWCIIWISGTLTNCHCITLMDLFWKCSSSLTTDALRLRRGTISWSWHGKPDRLSCRFVIFWLSLASLYVTLLIWSMFSVSLSYRKKTHTRNSGTQNLAEGKTNLINGKSFFKIIWINYFVKICPKFVLT